MTCPAGRLDPSAVFAYVFAGKATFTVRSPSGVRFTFDVRPLMRPVRENGQLAGPVDRWDVIPNAYNVRVLTGPDNTRSYTRIGVVYTEAASLPRNGSVGFNFRPQTGSAISADAPSCKAAGFTFRALLADRSGAKLPPGLEIWHDGRCARCGRKLTTPESLTDGIGPECARRMQEAA
jgi:hypothetical protein